MATPRPTGRAGLIRIPAPAAHHGIDMRFAPLADRDLFNPAAWKTEPLAESTAFPKWWEIDIDALALSDGVYEYEFIVDGDADHPVPDPYADEITRFGGYRGLFHIAAGQRIPQPFRWDGELPAGVQLPQNNEIVIYEMPLRWMSGAGPEREVDLGTFDEAVFERLNELADLGINCIELLPIQDSPDTLNWGYGTRFFFAPDFDMGSPVDTKYFIRCCHQRGIRVILDVVMNHSATSCPLTARALDWFYVGQEGDRNAWGGSLFRYRTPSYDNYFATRELHYEMAAFWIREYRIDGFRIDEFKGIDNWDFLQAFRENAWAEHNRLFPNRPFLVIGEDSNRRFLATHDGPNGRKVVDAIWNFSYRDEVRLLTTNQLYTNWGQPSRTERIQAMLSGSRMWDGYGGGSFREGYADMAQSIDYFTSHDVQDQPRFMNYIFAALLTMRWLGSGSIENIAGILGNLAGQSSAIQSAHNEAIDRVRSVFALLLTSVGIPMFLAGEEFADVHDFDYSDYRLKMSDPVDWSRRDIPTHRALWNEVRELIRLRTSHPALQRNEIELFYTHPDLDGNSGARVFAYCRTGARGLGSAGQVVVVANMGAQNFGSFDFWQWPWAAGALREVGAPAGGSAPQAVPGESRFTVSLGPFQARVFQS